jgi:hypothetical protein
MRRKGRRGNGPDALEPRGHHVVQFTRAIGVRGEDLRVEHCFGGGGAYEEADARATIAGS